MYVLEMLWKEKYSFWLCCHCFYFYISSVFFEGGGNFLCVMMRYVCSVWEVVVQITYLESLKSACWSTLKNLSLQFPGSCFLKCFAWATTYTKTWNYYMKINYEIHSKNILNHKCIDVGETSAFFFPYLRETKIPLTP